MAKWKFSLTHVREIQYQKLNNKPEFKRKTTGKLVVHIKKIRSLTHYIKINFRQIKDLTVRRKQF